MTSGEQLAEILRGCASSDPAAVRALGDWQNGKVGQSLLRMLGEPQQVQAARARLLADLAGESGAFVGTGETAAQDWLFARLRLAARHPQAEVRPARRLYAVPKEESPPAPAPRPHAAETDTAAASAIAGARLRPAGAPALSRPPAAVPAPIKADGGRGRWPRWLVLLPVLLLGGGIAGLAMIAKLPAPVAVPPPSIVSAPLPAVDEPALSVQEQVGQPIAGQEPPVVAAPMSPGAQPPERLTAATPATVPEPAPAPVAPETAAVAAPRIVVHHGGDPESTAVAGQLASQLQSAGFGAVEVRPVGFEVATTSIRFFFAGDRPAADRLTTAIGPFLSFHGRAVPGTPIGFTDYRPLPRQGTLEIWLPRR
jgi:hypothetical protein